VPRRFGSYRFRAREQQADVWIEIHKRLFEQITANTSKGLCLKRLENFFEEGSIINMDSASLQLLSTKCQILPLKSNISPIGWCRKKSVFKQK